MIAAMCLLLPLSAAPLLAGTASRFALVGCLVVGAGFLAAGVLHALRRTPASARIVLRTSLLYIPLVFGLLVFAGPR
jgi:heme O synthase-like polyprenyltransferase